MINLKNYQKEFEEVLKYSQEYPFDLDCKDIIEKWYQNKKHFIDLFGGTPIIQSDEIVEFTLSTEDKSKYFDDFVKRVHANGWAYYKYNNLSLKDFLWQSEAGFFDNKVTADPQMIGKIKIGDKLIKSLKYFFDDKKELRMCQDLASEYVQKNKIKGHIFFSVDPIDFLLASENNENWRSCHALDGEYRAGNLSYLLDETTVMVYLASADREHMRVMPHKYEAASKKVRLYIHIAENIMYYGKMYPFDLPHLRVYIKEVVNQLYDKAGFSSRRNFLMPEQVGFNRIQLPNGDYATLDENCFFYWGDIVKSSDVIKQSEHALNYYDLIYSSTYRPYASFSQQGYYYTSGIVDKFTIHIGEDVPCALGCGNTVVSENTFICPTCREKMGAWHDYFDHCVDCGIRLFEDDTYYCNNAGLMFCESCYDPYYDEDDDDY